jgi:parallel beta-helix repeat protein
MRKAILIIAICALAVGVLFLLGPAEAQTIIVDDDWAGADYDNIRDAIRAAKNGDTIRVYDGTYNEDNTVDKAINLVGNGTSTIIDGYKKDHVFGFKLMGGNTNVSGFYFYNWWPTHHYGGVGVYSNGNRISNNTFHYNNRGLFLGGCRDNLVINNTFDYNYYGLLVHEGSDNCRISFNTFTRSYSYGILYRYSRDLEIFSNTFENFTSGAMSVYRSSDVTVSFNMFDASEATSGNRVGAVLYEITNGEVHNNTFIGLGRAVTAVGTKDLRVEYNTILKGKEGLYFGRLWSGRYQLGAWCNGTVVRNNNMIGQSTFGANATYGQVTPIDARYNWWGDDSGPYHPVNNSNGVGTNASDLVTFDHWLSQMESDVPPIAYIHWTSPSFVNEGEEVTFYGHGLARNRTSLYVWTSSIDGELYSGPNVTFARSNLSPGTHTISLKVRDYLGRWSEDVSTILVVNGLPTANIASISPPVVSEGDQVSFIGEAFDLENDIVRIVWESDIDGILNNRLHFNTTLLSNGTHVITLMVMDGHGAWSGVATGEVIVNGIPRADIEPLEHPLVNEGEAVILRGLYHDHEDGVVSFWWGSDIDGELSDQPMFHTSALSNGTHTITFRVMDDFLVWSDNATVTVTVNGIPRVSILSISPQLATDDEAVSFEGGWTDHEDDVKVHEWRSDIDGPLSSLEDFETKLMSRGSHIISFRVMDGDGAWSEWAWSTLTVHGRPSAWIGPVQEPKVNEGGTVHLEGGFSDPEDDVRGYLWKSDIDGVVGTSRDLTTSDLSNGTHTITFRVEDGLGAWSAPASVVITVNGIPRGSIRDIDPVDALEGQAVKLSGSWNDHEGDVHTVEWRSDVDGLLGVDLDISVAQLSNGSHEITFRVMDGDGVWSEPVFGKVKVNGVPRSWIQSAGPERTLEGQTVLLSGTAEDDLAVVAYLWTSSIDGDLSQKAVVSVGDLSPGEHTITFAARDNEGIWSEPSTVTLVVEALHLGVELVLAELPESAVEGEVISIGCTLRNLGNVPLAGLSFRFHMNDQEVATIALEGALSPGTEANVEVLWTVEVGQHAAFVEVVHVDEVMCSKISDGTVLVQPLEDPDDPELPEGPGRSDDVDEGIDRVVVLAATIVIVVAVALLNVGWRHRR